MVPAVKVQLTYEERSALEAMAARNFRRPSEELRRLLQEALQSRPPTAKNESGARLDKSTGAAFPVQS